MSPHGTRDVLSVVDQVARDVLHCRDEGQVVIVGGIPLGRGQPTNFLKLHAAGEGPRGEALIMPGDTGRESGVMVYVGDAPMVEGLS